MSNLSLPGNPRYQPKSLIDYFGYDNLYRCVAEVEFANIDVLHQIGVIPDSDYVMLTPEIRELVMGIPTTVIDMTERKVTKHDIEPGYSKPKS